MQPFDSLDRLEELTQLDPLAARMRQLVQEATGTQSVRDALHGVWLGHPLHPVLVQVPIGAWTSATILDFVPRTGPAVSLLIGTGIASAVPAAAAGWTDWSALNPQEGRTGLVHATANITAIALYGASLFARLRGRRMKGKALALAGLTSASLGGIIGGHLSYRRAAGANHNAQLADVAPSGWVDVGALDELAEGALTRREVGKVSVLLLRRGSTVHALAEQCSHLSGPLSEGRLSNDDGPCVICPWHGSTFRLSDGGVVHGPATAPQPVFETRVLSDHVEVRLAT